MQLWRAIRWPVGFVVGLIGLLYAIQVGSLFWLALSVGSVSKKELQRLPSPNGRRTAIVTRTNGGATTSYGYFVHVDGEEAFMAYGSSIRGNYGMDVRWRDSRTIEATFDRARGVRVGKVSDLKVVVRGKVEEP